MAKRKSHIERLQSLLAMSKSEGCSPEEAATAQRKLRKYLLKYNMTLGDIEEVGDISSPLNVKQHQFIASDGEWASIIIVHIADLYFCSVTSINYRPTQKVWSLWGTETNIAIAKSIIQSIFDTLGNETNTHIIRKQPQNQTEMEGVRESFLSGAACTIQQRCMIIKYQENVQEHTPSPDNDKALMALGSTLMENNKAAIDTATNGLNVTKTAKITNPNEAQYDAYSAGAVKGMSANIRQSVTVD